MLFPHPKPSTDRKKKNRNSLSWLTKPSISWSLLASAINLLYTPPTLASLLFLKYTKHTPTSSFCIGLPQFFQASNAGLEAFPAQVGPDSTVPS